MPVAKRKSKAAPVEVEEVEFEELEDELEEVEEDELDEDFEEETEDEEGLEDSEEDDDELAELEEPEDLDEEEVKAEAKPKKAAKKKTPAKPKLVGQNVAWLVQLIADETGKKVQPPQVRGWLRSLAKKGEVEHADKGRWVFSGIEDPKVVVLLEAIKSGKFDSEKKGNTEALAKARAKAAENRAKKKAAQEALDAGELDADEDEVEEEAPKPKPRRKKAAAKK